MKFIIELIISWLFHPLAVVLAWINIARRHDLKFSRKVAWAAICIIWGVGPTLYLLVGDGALW